MLPRSTATRACVIEQSSKTVRPATRVVVYQTRCQDWTPENFKVGIPAAESCEQVHHTINAAEHALIIAAAWHSRGLMLRPCCTAGSGNSTSSFGLKNRACLLSTDRQTRETIKRWLRPSLAMMSNSSEGKTYSVCSREWGQAQKSITWMSSPQKTTDIFTHQLRREATRQDDAALARNVPRARLGVRSLQLRSQTDSPAQ